MSFSKRKFLSLTLPSQHKKAYEWLRQLYDSPTHALQSTYLQMCDWMGLDPLCFEREEIANRVHFHVQKSGRGIKEDCLLPHVRHQDRQEASPFLDITIYLDQVRSAHNVGSILRTTEALSLGRVALSAMTPSPDHGQVKRAAMGCETGIVWERKDLAVCPRPILALETSDEAIALDEFEFPKTFTLVLGNEERGCSDEALRMADHLIEIPLFGRKNSLNVANAYAIAAHVITRRLRHEVSGRQ